MRRAGTIVAIVTLGAACSLAWDDLDPRLAEGAGGATIVGAGGSGARPTVRAERPDRAGAGALAARAEVAFGTTRG